MAIYAHLRDADIYSLTTAGLISELSIYFLFSIIFYLYYGEYKDRQIKRDIRQVGLACYTMLLMAVPSGMLQYLLYQSYIGKIYWEIGDGLFDYIYPFLSYVMFVFLMDTFIYWFHRMLHTPWLYDRIHKTHHSFHPISSFTASVLDPLDLLFTVLIPGYLPLLIIPMYIDIQMLAVVTTFIWGIYVHNSKAPRLYGYMLYDAADHRIHHDTGKYNYALFTTFWDKACDTYR